jgi:hypothetical protein
VVNQYVSEQTTTNNAPNVQLVQRTWFNPNLDYIWFTLPSVAVHHGSHKGSVSERHASVRDFEQYLADGDYCGAFRVVGSSGFRRLRSLQLPHSDRRDAQGPRSCSIRWNIGPPYDAPPPTRGTIYRPFSHSTR